MGFEDSLQSQRPPARVGEVRLSFEGSFFLGQADHPRDTHAAELLNLGAVAGGVSALAVLLADGSSLAAALLALAAGALGLCAIVFRRRVRARRAFSLNFATESLRVDFLEGRLARPRTEIVPFDAVEAVEIVPAAGRHRLEVIYRTDRGRVRRALIEHARPDEVEALRRLWRLLRNGFGLKPAGGEG